jgi:hypothetical protein
MASGKPQDWEKIGRILVPDPNSQWMSTHTGPSFVRRLDRSIFGIYVTGRDSRNRSHIGKGYLDMQTLEVRDLAADPVLSPGDLGLFDENGVSYPQLVEHQGYDYMFYVGWVPTVLTPFQNHLGLCRSEKGADRYTRVSRAPILPRTDLEPCGTGSCCCLIENGVWRLWYTSFIRWSDRPDEFQHYYLIRYAESNDGVSWKRSGHVCIDFKNSGEYAICRPSVIKDETGYHMWFAYRGERYRIGYAHSPDGIRWERRDDLVGIGVSQNGWDSEALCYPHVFHYEDDLYMLYCGNEYGKAGLGIATLKDWKRKV